MDNTPQEACFCPLYNFAHVKEAGCQAGFSSPPEIQKIAEMLGGKVEHQLPHGSAVVSFPLPADHWLTKEGYNEPPMPWRTGQSPKRDELAFQLKTAARYAVRASTMNGKEIDFDPDAMVQNFITGMLGYYTADGFSHLDDMLSGKEPWAVDKANERQVGGDHYKTPGKPEHWDLAIMFGWDFFQYQITKYVMRWKKKAGVEDLRKAAHFLEKYIENYHHFNSEPAPDYTNYDLLKVYDQVKEIEAQFTYEGGYGSGMTEYTCKRCKAKIMAVNPVAAFAEHGDCLGPNYVNQDR